MISIPLPLFPFLFFCLVPPAAFPQHVASRVSEVYLSDHFLFNLRRGVIPEFLNPSSSSWSLSFSPFCGGLRHIISSLLYRHLSKSFFLVPPLCCCEFFTPFPDLSGFAQLLRLLWRKAPTLLCFRHMSVHARFIFPFLPFTCFSHLEEGLRIPYLPYIPYSLSYAIVL